MSSSSAGGERERPEPLAHREPDRVERLVLVGLQLLGRGGPGGDEQHERDDHEPMHVFPFFVDETQLSTVVV